MKQTCDVGDCGKQAIGEFREIQDVSGFTTTDAIPISETKFCEDHEELVSRGSGYTVYYPVNI